MKVTVDFDITPDEVRKLFGLPDVEAFQRQMMDDIRERMTAGAEGYDPIKLFQPYMAGTMASWDMFQKMLTNVAGMSGSGPRLETRARMRRPKRNSNETASRVKAGSRVLRSCGHPRRSAGCGSTGQENEIPQPRQRRRLLVLANSSRCASTAGTRPENP